MINSRSHVFFARPQPAPSRFDPNRRSYVTDAKSQPVSFGRRTRGPTNCVYTQRASPLGPLSASLCHGSGQPKVSPLLYYLIINSHSRDEITSRGSGLSGVSARELTCKRFLDFRVRDVSRTS